MKQASFKETARFLGIGIDACRCLSVWTLWAKLEGLKERHNIH